MGLIWPKLLVPPVASGIQYVGGVTGSRAGSTSADFTLALDSGLTGGIASSVSEDDFVLAVVATGSAADRTLSITDGTNNYTLIGSELYSDDTYDTNLRVGYKFMGASPDALTTFGPSGNTADALCAAVFVFRGVDLTTPLDVAAVTATGVDSGHADPPSITPSTPGAWIVCVGACGLSSFSSSYSNSDNLSGFVSRFGSDNNDCVLGGGYKDDWTSGAFDAAAFTLSINESTNNSWAAMAIALRPA